MFKENMEKKRERGMRVEEKLRLLKYFIAFTSSSLGCYVVVAMSLFLFCLLMGLIKNLSLKEFSIHSNGFFFCIIIMREMRERKF